MKGGKLVKKSKFTNFIILLAITILILAGCSNKEKEISELKGQALQYLDDGDFNNAIELYEKMLEIKEDTIIREELKEIKYEKESVEVIKNFLDIIKNANINYNRAESLVELKDVFLDIQQAVNQVEKIDTDKETDISKYLKEIKSLNDYKYLKELINDEYIMSSEKKESLATIQQNSGLGDSLSFGNALILGQAQQNLRQHTDYILEIEVPSKYKNIF